MKKNLPEITDSEELTCWLIKFNSGITLQDLDELTYHQYARNSLMAMTKDWNLFSEFCRSKRVKSLPSSTTAVRLFLEKEARIRKYATLKRYTVTISVIHRILVQKDPTSSSVVKSALSGLRLTKHGDATQAAAFNAKHMGALDNALSRSKSIRDLRNLALCYVMFECALKRNEVRNLNLEQFSDTEMGMTLSIGDKTYRLSAPARDSMTKWFTALPYSTGPAFRAIDRHGNISLSLMDDSSLYRVVRSVSDIIGVSIQFSGQSMRVGAAKELAKRGLKVKEIQEFGRWLSPAMPYQYTGNKAAAEAEKMAYLSFKPLE